jgi:hypothetical protein
VSINSDDRDDTPLVSLSLDRGLHGCMLDGGRNDPLQRLPGSTRATNDLVAAFSRAAREDEAFGVAAGECGNGVTGVGEQ